MRHHSRNHLKDYREHRLKQNFTHVIILAQNHPPLAVADQRPSDIAVSQLVDRDLAGESAIGLIEYVLRGHLNALAEMLPDGQEIERWRGDDDFYSGSTCKCVSHLVSECGQEERIFRHEAETPARHQAFQYPTSFPCRQTGSSSGTTTMKRSQHRLLHRRSPETSKHTYQHPGPVWHC